MLFTIFQTDNFFSSNSSCVIMFHLKTSCAYLTAVCAIIFTIWCTYYGYQIQKCRDEIFIRKRHPSLILVITCIALYLMTVNLCLLFVLIFDIFSIPIDYLRSQLISFCVNSIQLFLYSISFRYISISHIQYTCLIEQSMVLVL